jgi:hypothetical protein
MRLDKDGYLDTLTGAHNLCVYTFRFGDQQTTDYFTIDENGRFELFGKARNLVDNFHLPPAMCTPFGGAYKDIRNDVECVIMPDGIDSGFRCAIPFPRNIDNTDANSLLMLANGSMSVAGSVGQKVRLSIEFKYRKAGDSMATAANETDILENTMDADANDVSNFIIRPDATNTVDFDIMYMKFTRTGSHVNDNRAGDLQWSILWAQYFATKHGISP